MAERIEDLLIHQDRIPFGTSDLDQLAAPFAERIRSKQQRQQAQQDGNGPAKEVYPERSSSELLRELGPEYVAHVFWELLRCDQILQRNGLSQRQCRLAEIQVVGRLLAPRSELGTVAIHASGYWGTNEGVVRNWSGQGSLMPSDWVAWLGRLHVDWVGISVALNYDDSMDSTVERHQ